MGDADEESLERYRTLVEASGDPMYILDDGGRFTFVNGAMAGLTGYDEGELLEGSIDRILAEGEYDRGSAIIAHLLSNGEEQAKYETILRTADGDTIPCENQLSVLFEDDAFVGSVGVIRDIRSRKQRERRLAALQEVTRRILDGTSRHEVADLAVEAARDVLDMEASSIHLHDPDAGLVPVATTSELRELIGDPPTFPGGESIAWRAFESGSVEIVEDVREDPDVYNPDTPIRSEAYIPLGDHGLLLMGSADLGDFERLVSTYGELLAGEIIAVLDRVEREERLRDREAELVRQNERLDDFASIVSHDLRNPLTVASGRLDLASDECESEHVPPIERALERMETLIDELLVFARMGEEATNPCPVDLPDVARESWEQVDTHEATLAAGTGATIRADRVRLQRLLENLFRNAIEHAGPAVTVRVAAREDGFVVTDDGPGIPAEDRDRVFERGFSTNSEGTGFGLPIVEEIANAHGWSVSTFEPESGGAGFAFEGVSVVP